jgi:hypothetical protein
MRAWAARDKGCRLEVVRDAGHFSNYYRPDQVNNFMASFLTATLPTKQPETPVASTPEVGRGQGAAVGLTVAASR